MNFEHGLSNFEQKISTNRYIHPIVPSEYHGIPVVVPIVDDPRTHRGQFQGAVDFIVPVGTLVVAARKGVVVSVIDKFATYGDSEEFAAKANLISIGHDNNEFTYYIHLGKDTAVVKPGDYVETGQLIASTGYSGWMTDKFPHLHFYVGHALGGIHFEGRKINFIESTFIKFLDLKKMQT